MNTDKKNATALAGSALGSQVTSLTTGIEAVDRLPRPRLNTIGRGKYVGPLRAL